MNPSPITLSSPSLALHRAAEAWLHRNGSFCEQLLCLNRRAVLAKKAIRLLPATKRKRDRREGRPREDYAVMRCTIKDSML